MNDKKLYFRWAFLFPVVDLALFLFSTWLISVSSDPRMGLVGLAFYSLNLPFIAIGSFVAEWLSQDNLLILVFTVIASSTVLGYVSEKIYQTALGKWNKYLSSFLAAVPTLIIIAIGYAMITLD